MSFIKPSLNKPKFSEKNRPIVINYFNETHISYRSTLPFAHFLDRQDIETKF